MLGQRIAVPGASGLMVLLGVKHSDMSVDIPSTSLPDWETTHGTGEFMLPIGSRHAALDFRRFKMEDFETGSNLRGKGGLPGL